MNRFACACYLVKYQDLDERVRSVAVCAMSVAGAVEACEQYDRYQPNVTNVREVLSVELVAEPAISPEGRAIRPEKPHD